MNDIKYDFFYDLFSFHWEKQNNSLNTEIVTFADKNSIISFIINNFVLGAPRAWKFSNDSIFKAIF